MALAMLLIRSYDGGYGYHGVGWRMEGEVTQQMNSYVDILRVLESVLSPKFEVTSNISP